MLTFASTGVRRAAAATAALACSLIGGAADAQPTGTPLERFQPAPAGDALFASPSAGVDAHLAFDASAVFSYADAPLALRSRNAAGTYTDIGTVVGHQAVLNVLASASLFSRAKLELALPITLDQGGASPVVAGTMLPSPSGAALNDLRLGLRITALEARGYWPGAALSFSAFLPTGDANGYTGAGVARFEPRLILGADYGRLVWSASVGRQLGASSGLLGSEVTFSAGVAARIDRFQIGPEIFGSAAVDRTSSSQGVPLSDRAGGGLEALLGAKANVGPFTFGAAGGLGFLRGPGTPDFRLIGSISIRPFEIKKTPAGFSLFSDGSADANEKRGNQGEGDASARPHAGGTGAGDAQKPAAPLDTDGDTVPDSEDKCPRVVGDPRPDAPKRGCPPDKDGDGIPDVEDRCPEVPGVFAEGDRNGCPPDSDGDGLADPDDACPKEAGPKTDDPKTTGCPASVRIVGTQIVILQQVNFETAKARILPASFPLLQQVAAVLTEHPDIARVAVDGHTDNRGNDASNLDLSRARAVSVMRWLTEKGIDPRRLEARGFGPRRPIADNTTDEGRAKNRRVEFQIKKRTDKGEAGWVDGPVE